MTPDPRHPKPNEPCLCGSGVRFKFCHQPVLTAPHNKVLPTGHEQYVRAWSTNSGHFEAKGYYADLAKEVCEHEPRRLLDIGCGLGQGLKAIATAMPPGERFIIALDENPLCLEASAIALAAAAIETRIIKRINYSPIPNSRNYELSYAPGELKEVGDVSLIQSDVLNDTELDDFLSRQPPFDAITLWFYGTHTARQGLRQRGGKNDEQNERELTEARTFEIARHILKKGGIVHLAMRGRSGSADLGGLAASRLAQIESLVDNDFKIGPPAVRPYTEPTNFNRIGMVSRHHDASGLDHGGIASVIAIKR
jgi:SAM-dependent methyltransferase